MLIRVIFLFISILLFSIHPALSQEHNAAERHSVVFLFDVSDSIKKNDRGSYFKDFQMVLNSLSEGDDFVALKIGENSQLLRPICSGMVPVRERLETSGHYENKKRKAIGGAIQQAGNFLRDTTDKRTSIISSLIAVNDYFATKENAKKYIFIFSDMVEASNFLNMERPGNYAVKKYINLNPNHLKNAHAYILGVTTGERNFEKVKQFWTDFFKQYEIDVDYYQYALLNFSFK